MNKRIQLLTVFILLAFAFSHAQERFGISVGGSFSRMCFEELGMSIPQQTYTGVIAGVVTEAMLSDQMYLQAGVAYHEMGSKYKRAARDIYFAPQYITVPLAFGMKLQGNHIRPKAFAGAYAAYGIGGKHRPYSGAYDSGISYGTGLYKDLKRFDYGLRIGAGMDFRSFELLVQYGYGLENIAPTETYDMVRYNRFVTITATYFIDLRFKMPD